MVKPIASHPYSDRAAFDRLLLLIATLAQQPGLGCPPKARDAAGHHDAIAAILDALPATAAAQGMALPAYAPACGPTWPSCASTVS